SLSQALNKSKKAQEVDALLSENEMLQGKLHSQEDDFRLQNSTLMQELSKLCSQIEQLEKDNQILQEGKTAVASEVAFPASPVDGELLRLQAENSALQKNMAALQERYEKEVARQAENRGGGKGDGSPDPCPTQLLSEVELKLQTEREEKILLKEQLQSLEASKTTETSRLQQELSKATEQLKKKKTMSLSSLSSANKFSLSPFRTKIEEIQQRKEEELKSLQVRNQKLQQELQSTNQGFLELKDQLQSGKKEHELALQTLQDQIQTSKTQEMNLMREQVAALGDELQQRQNEKEALAAQRDDLNTQLQESLRGNTRLMEQVQELVQEKERLLQELDEVRKTAEKRKAMLDEMAIETQQEKGRHKEELGNLRLQHEKEMLAVRARYERELRELHEHKKRQEDELRGQLKEEKARSQELESMQQTVEELRLQIQSMDGTKGWFERRLKEAEVLIWKRNGISMSLWQEVKDTLDGQRILEKKGSAALKDLKRQLHLERKRADKLQERLQEILTNSKSRTGIEDLVLADISSPSRTQTGDSSSISSFSYREIMKEGSEITAFPEMALSSQPPRPADLSDEEISELFQRLAEVQQEKWLLEEKVKHLEVSSASMAEDLCRKSAIIETYVMDSRIDVSGAHGQVDRSSLSSVLRDLVKPGDENLREMNKKLQNMLEEQLTKNMHLQKKRKTSVSKTSNITESRLHSPIEANGESRPCCSHNKPTFWGNE
uniref:GRIP1 associated protein 1 n=1 Tax=Naja naja TaxID=35670 RepID=A0A8C6XPD3_NAJNA